MTLPELDAQIRTMMPDGYERRILLTAVGDLTEGLNQVLGYLLSVQGYTYDEDKETWSKTKNAQRRQVNPSPST